MAIIKDNYKTLARLLSTSTKNTYVPHQAQGQQKSKYDTFFFFIKDQTKQKFKIQNLHTSLTGSARILSFDQMMKLFWKSECISKEKKSENLWRRNKKNDYQAEVQSFSPCFQPEKFELSGKTMILFKSNWVAKREDFLFSFQFALSWNKNI